MSWHRSLYNATATHVFHSFKYSILHYGQVSFDLFILLSYSLIECRRPVTRFLDSISTQTHCFRQLVVCSRSVYFDCISVDQPTDLEQCTSICPAIIFSYSFSNACIKVYLTGPQGGGISCANASRKWRKPMCKIQCCHPKWNLANKVYAKVIVRIVVNVFVLFVGGKVVNV